MKRIATAAARPGVWQALLWLALLAIGLTVVPTGAQPADSGEFQLVARDLGVAHPPGYPLYTMAAHLFGRVALAIPPLRDLGWPWAVNAFSMVLAVATLAVVAWTAARLGGTWVAGAVAAVLLAFSPTFGAQALVANIRMGTGLFTAGVLGLTLSWLAEGGRDEATAYGPHPPTPSPKFGGGGGSRVGGDRTLVALCFVGALAAGHHPTLAALALPIGLAVVARRPAVLRDARLTAQCLAAALVGLLPLAYLPIRAAQGAPLAPSDLATAGGVWRHITAAGFRGDMLAITGARDLGDRLLVLANILQLQFTPLALALIAIGAIWLLARRRAEAVALLGTALIVSWLAITYRAPQTMEYLLPAFVVLAIVAGSGAVVLVHWVRDLVVRALGRRPLDKRVLGRAAPVVQTLELIVAAAFLYYGLAAHGRAPLHARAAVPDLAAITRLAADPDCLSSDTTVLASWHFATPLWLAGLRAPADARSALDAPYVTANGAPIVYVHPDFATGDPIGQTWRKRAAAAAESGAVLLTNRSAELMADDAPLVPSIAGPFWWRGGAHDQRENCAQDAATVWSPMRAALGVPPDAWELGDGFIRRDIDALSVHLLVGANPDVSTEGVVAFAQLVDLDRSVVVGQADRPLGRPETRKDRRTAFAIRLDITPFRAFEPRNRHAIDVGLYRRGPSGSAERIIVREVMFDLPDSARSAVPYIPAASEAIVGGTALRLLVLVPPALSLAQYAQPAPTAGSVPYGSALSLLHSTVHRTPTALVVDLTWQADARPFASDYTVSVQAAATDAAWRAQHDGTPALGAIPTIKWLPGMIIRDRHRIPLPPEAAGHDGPYTVTVGVYDAFSLEPLPVTDGELVRQGQGQRAVVFESP